MSYIGTNSGRRHLAQDPLADGPPGTVPEEDVEVTDTQADAAMAPMPMGEPCDTYCTLFGVPDCVAW